MPCVPCLRSVSYLSAGGRAASMPRDCAAALARIVLHAPAVRSILHGNTRVLDDPGELGDVGAEAAVEFVRRAADRQAGKARYGQRCGFWKNQRT